jgi:hypothetical protein
LVNCIVWSTILYCKIEYQSFILKVFQTRSGQIIKITNHSIFTISFSKFTQVPKGGIINESPVSKKRKKKKGK